MLISERLKNLFEMMRNISEEFDVVNPIARRMLATGIIAEMHHIEEDLTEINNNLDTSISENDASLSPADFELDSYDFHDVWD